MADGSTTTDWLGDDDPIPDQREQQRTVLRRYIPARFSEASFLNYVPAHPSQDKAKRVVQRWLTDAGASVMLALTGPPGIGKSHLLWSAAQVLASEARGFFATSWYRYADGMRGTSLAVTRTERERLYGSHIILIDEVRRTASTDLDETELTKFACAAYDHGARVLITTNVHPLATIMGAAAASRFYAFPMEGPDRRQQR